MIFEFNLILNTYSILVVLILLYHSFTHFDRKSPTDKFYISMLVIMVFMLILDLLSRLDSHAGTIIPLINHAANYLMFASNAVIPSIWLLYVLHFVLREKEKIKKYSVLIFLANLIQVFCVTLSLRYGWFYTIDENNIYYRGPLFVFSSVLSVMLFIISFLLSISNRRKIKNEYFKTLVFFTIPIFVCIVFQVLFYGLALTLNSIVLSLLITFLNIQNRKIETDYLTGISNRKKLDRFLNKRIQAGNEFSAIMIDLDNFKSINDKYGHVAGDNMLIDAARILKSCLRAGDLISRFGGDEFCIILDITDEKALESAVCRISNNIKKYNARSGNGNNNLSVSMGYAVYKRGMKAQDFLKLIDDRMYENKMKNKIKKIAKSETAEGCYVCNWINHLKREDICFVAELQSGYVVLNKRYQYFKGYTLFVSKIHADELHKLPDEIRSQFMNEMALVSEAVQNAFGSAKINCESLGNSQSHVHWHIIPRYATDPCPDQAIWNLDQSVLESVKPTESEITEIKTALAEQIKILAPKYRTKAILEQYTLR